jgi:hypothetical protein
MVAAASNAQANGKSPVHSTFQMYFNGLEAFGQAYDPFLKGIARSQLEVMGFLNRRTQACMEAPARLSQCRTPQDVMTLQAGFWQAAYQDYTESMGRVTSAMALAMPHLGGLASDDAQNAHDYIAFPETKEQTGSGRTRDRKAA